MSKIYIGMGGWELHPFNKYFYPPKPKKGFRKLEFYSQFFDNIEINATFYNTSFSPDHAKRWLNDVAANKDFIFTVKLFRGFTHTFTATKEDVRNVKIILDLLAGAGRLGGLVIQFPASFSYHSEYCKYLTRLSIAFKEYPMFVEVRHKSWNNPLMYNFFQENKLHLVNVDLPAINDHISFNSLVWDGAAYFRMMGRNTNTWMHPWRLETDGKHIVSDRYNYLYNDEELEELISFIEKVRNDARTIFVVFHNDPNAKSLCNGFRLRHLLEPLKKIAIPQTIIRAFPELKQIRASLNYPLFEEQFS